MLGGFGLRLPGICTGMCTYLQFRKREPSGKNQKVVGETHPEFSGAVASGSTSRT